MLTLFWDTRGVILEHYMPRGNTVTSKTYSDLLQNHLPPAIKSKRRGRLSTGVLLQHDNARPHTARSTVATIQDLSFECSTSAVLARPRPQWLSCLWTAQRRWDTSLSGPTKKCSKRCTSGCALSQKIFFVEVCMHFRSAGTLVWNTNGDYIKHEISVYLLCQINYEIKIFKVFIWSSSYK